MKNPILRRLLLVLFACGVGPAFVHADIRIRVSFNFIQNNSGSRPPGTVFGTNATVIAEVNAANQILATEGRGYSLELLKDGNGQIVIGDVPNYTDPAFVSASTPVNPSGHAYLIAPSGATAQAIENHARQANSNYNFRTDAVNVYVVQGAGGFVGYCSFPSDNRSTILVSSGSDGRPPGQLILHEIGHFFNLAHTFDSCSCCLPQTNPGCSNTFGDDGGIADTLPDFFCANASGVNVSATQAEIVTNGNSTGFLSAAVYASLTLAEQGFVDRSVNNLMSYRSNANRITEDQMDRWTTTANIQRLVAVTGKTFFTATDGNNSSTGLMAILPIRTLASAYARVSGTDDIILLRTGSYHENITLNQPCTLRATRGAATIGQ